jgi:hypothetical protein
MFIKICKVDIKYSFWRGSNKEKDIQGRNKRKPNHRRIKTICTVIFVVLVSGKASTYSFQNNT